MAQVKEKEIVEIPSNCQVSVDKGTITIKGEKGEVKKNLFNPLVSITMEGNNIVLSTKVINKKSKKTANTFKAHIKNLIKGSSQGHTYKLKICSGHFPMTVSLKGDVLEVKNFIGEKVPRTQKVLEGTNVKVDGSEIIVESINKEKAGQMAASIEQLTRRPGFDRRIFQDGIYITEKDGKIIG